MPKRVCAIILTPDEQTIISADKFGDVYSLPMHPSSNESRSGSTVDVRNGAFQPSATELTVHTKGNLEALRQQMLQKNVQSQREAPDFEHRLLLGHVSLLTDVAIATTKVAGETRPFILTSDRDEHVRVSRYPQAHIVRGYCLGFRDFVSKISIVPWAQQYLIVGSGEPSLKVFDWHSRELKSQTRFDDRSWEVLHEVLAKMEGERTLEKLAVSGIWPVHLQDPGGQSSPEDASGAILVALEGLPILLSLMMYQDGQLRYHQTILLSGNVLDVIILPDETTRALISIDNIHLPGSMVREKLELSECKLLTTLEFHGSDLTWSERTETFGLNAGAEAIADIPKASEPEAASSSRPRGEYSTLGEFLYGLENLRKKRGVAEELDDSVAAAEELAAAE